MTIFTEIVLWYLSSLVETEHGTYIDRAGHEFMLDKGTLRLIQKGDEKCRS